MLKWQLENPDINWQSPHQSCLIPFFSKFQSLSPSSSPNTKPLSPPSFPNSKSLSPLFFILRRYGPCHSNFKFQFYFLFIDYYYYSIAFRNGGRFSEHNSIDSFMLWPCSTTGILKKNSSHLKQAITGMVYTRLSGALQWIFKWNYKLFYLESYTNQSIMKFLLDRVYMTKTKRQGWKGLKLRKNRIERFENFGNFEWVEWNMDRMVH